MLLIKLVSKSFNSQEVLKLLNISLKKLTEESEFKMLDLIGKYWVLMCLISIMLHGFLIKMLMLLQVKNVQLNQSYLFMRTGLKLDF